MLGKLLIVQVATANAFCCGRRNDEKLHFWR
jgi:hypothetical protein